jgi:AraC family transcriptional regulator of adaptative response / DNA-3-methyladenine glycosylase II
MTFDPDAAYQAILARDARFDGRLFVGVTSTGIYCRPICRVRTPMKKNCRFFATAAQAEAATFRPCMKCRPEIAPGPGLPWTVMDASRTLARQAALGLDAQAADGEAPGIAALAERLGVSERHLRRIFLEEHGVTPLQYLQTRRLHLAKQLLTDTRLPVAQVALTSGFRSLRRFNAAFADSYRMNPARLRKAAAEPDARRADPAPSVTVALAHRLPYDTTALLRFVAQRAIPGVESVDGLSIRRSVRAGTLGAEAGWIAATFLPEAARVRLEFAPALTPASGRIVAAARTLALRLVATFVSQQWTAWPVVDRSLPAPETLADVEPARIAELGIIGARAQAIVALARAWPEIASALQPRSEPDVLIERLCRLPGIGPWTAHYVAMRVLGWPDAFPPNDVAVLKAMRQLFGTASPRDALARAQTWQPWRSYAVLRLWNTLGAST